MKKQRKKTKKYITTSQGMQGGETSPLKSSATSIKCGPIGYQKQSSLKHNNTIYVQKIVLKSLSVVNVKP